MRQAITLLCMALLLPNMTGCGLLILHSALERNADRKETHEAHRHQERMRELDLQQRLQDKQYPQVYTTDGGAIVRETPF
jgi:hypothetical protein